MFSFKSHLIGCSWTLQIPRGKEAIEDVGFLVGEKLYSCNHQLVATIAIKDQVTKNAEGSAAGFVGYL